MGTPWRGKGLMECLLIIHHCVSEVLPYVCTRQFLGFEDYAGTLVGRRLISRRLYFDIHFSTILSLVDQWPRLVDS